MPEHYLLKNTVPLPKEALLRSPQLSADSHYLTKSAAAPGDDDDYHSATNVISGWNNSFLTKTIAAPGDDDDYYSATNVISGWNNSFLTKTDAAPGDDDDYYSATNVISGWNNSFDNTDKDNEEYIERVV